MIIKKKSWKIYKYDKNEYNREYMMNRRYRQNMKKLTWFSFLPRNIDEDIVFNKKDLDYIKIINKYY
jgi:hypothetical protein